MFLKQSYTSSFRGGIFIKSAKEVILEMDQSLLVTLRFFKDKAFGSHFMLAESILN